MAEWATRQDENSLHFEARRIPLAPTVSVGVSFGTLCVPRMPLGVTRSVEDGIPTQERGNEFSVDDGPRKVRARVTAKVGDG
jgi:hypothetical protein